MIPSSLAAFQTLVVIVGLMSLVACGMTGYLLGFHIYLCKLNGIDEYILFFNKVIIICQHMILLLIDDWIVQLIELYHNLIN